MSTKASTLYTLGEDKALGNDDNSESSKAGLQFKVPVVRDIMRNIASKTPGNIRISGGAPVYLAAVAEYITAELLELSGNKSRDRADVNNVISVKDLFDAIVGDEELNRLYSCETIQLGQMLDPPPALFVDESLHFSDEGLAAVCRHLNSRSNAALRTVGLDEELGVNDLAAIKTFVHSMVSQYTENSAKDLKVERLVERGLPVAPLCQGVTTAAVQIRRSVLLGSPSESVEGKQVVGFRKSVAYLLNRLRNEGLLGDSGEPHPIEFLEASVVNSIELLLAKAKVLKENVGAASVDGRSSVQLAVELLTLHSLPPLRFSREAVEAAMACLPCPETVAHAAKAVRSRWGERYELIKGPLAEASDGSVPRNIKEVQQVFGFDRPRSVGERLLIDVGAALGNLKVLIDPSGSDDKLCFQRLVREVAQGIILLRLLSLCLTDFSKKK